MFRTVFWVRNNNNKEYRSGGVSTHSPNASFWVLSPLPWWLCRRFWPALDPQERVSPRSAGRSESARTFYFFIYSHGVVLRTHTQHPPVTDDNIQRQTTTQPFNRPSSGATDRTRWRSDRCTRGLPGGMKEGKTAPSSSPRTDV